MRLIAILLAACATRPPIVISDARCGPIDGATSLTPEMMRQAFGGDVTRSNGGYRVTRSGTWLLVAKPDERGKVCEVNVFSPTVAVRGKPWRAHRKLSGADQLTNCGCWGDLLACWTRGEHVALTFTLACDGTQRRELNGHTVYSIIWSPEPFGDQLDLDRCKDVPSEGDDDDDDAQRNVTIR